MTEKTRSSFVLGPSRSLDRARYGRHLVSAGPSDSLLFPQSRQVTRSRRRLSVMSMERPDRDDVEGLHRHAGRCSP